MTAEKKRGLGRGLDALFRDVRTEEESFQPMQIKRADELVAASQALAHQAPAVKPSAEKPRKLAVDKLTPGKFQPRRRFDDAALSELADSISAHGVLQPLLVRPLSDGRYEIIAGERRWRAAQKAKVHELPVVIQELSDKATLEIALIENLQREDLSAIEEAEGYQRLMDDFAHTQEQLSQRLGKSRSHVANTLRLLKLPRLVREMLQRGDLTAGHARALVTAKDPESLAREIVARGLSVRQAEKLAQGETDRKPALPRGVVQKDADILSLERRLTAQLGLKVIVEATDKGGRLSIEYKSLDQLDDLILRLSKTP